MSVDTSTTGPIEVEFRYGRAEYQRAIARHYRSALKLRRDLIAGILAVALGAYLALVHDAGWMAWLLAVLGGVLLLMIAYAVLVLPRVLYWTQPKLKNQYRLSFSDDGIRFVTDNVDAALGWSIYHAWRADDEFYLLYHGRRDLSVVPRRALTSHADSRLRAMLEHTIGPPAR